MMSKYVFFSQEREIVTNIGLSGEQYVFLFCPIQNHQTRSDRSSEKKTPKPTNSSSGIMVKTQSVSQLWFYAELI